jgi:putative NADPH-quinone reductase
MGRRITIIQGHPTRGGHFCHALADAYADGAAQSGHEVRRLDVAAIDFPLLRSKDDWNDGIPHPGILDSQKDIRWADHLLIIYPLWLGAMPALLKAFLEQVLRPGFAMRLEASGRWHTLLQGRSARVVVTMGMPALAYRWIFGAFSLRSLERNILHFVGIRPCRHTLIGMVETIGDTRRRAWLDALRDLGRNGR